ncbi:terminase large subunit domain-containing protein [Caulobacter soli]|uniref:terminase large subunit domain-containing protein n=1 Tax=Caulobacter soli TaxID=2708539 RepID=UPI0013EBFFBB|nr:terminase family protein [Caulobacter soli]
MAFDIGPITNEEWAAHRREAMQAMPAFLAGKALPDILMPSQKALLLATASNKVVVSDKSRRIGFTWAVAADAVLTAGAQKTAGGMDVLYIGYNLDMAREFIDTSGMWAKAFAPAVTEVGEFLFDDPDPSGKGADKKIQAFRIGFASGFEIVALSSRPRSLRGRQGYVILDEFAFHDDPRGLLKAAMALLIWGGKVLVISTHNGVDNPFNELIQEVHSGKRPGKVVRCTFDQALEEGLYQRVCLTQGIEWTPEGEAAFRAETRASYGADAAEELDCVPSQGSGVYLSRALIEACSTADAPVLRLHVKPEFELEPEHQRRSYVDAWLEQTVLPEIKKLDRGLRHFFGEDFALTGDVSGLVPISIDRNLKRRVPFMIEMRHVPHEQQKQVVFFLGQNMPRFSGGKLDGNGNGSFLGQVTLQKFGESRIEVVKPTQDWYRENMPKMQALFSDRDISIPAHTDVVDDLRQIKLIKGIPMVPKDAHHKGSDGLNRHGDFGVALCLAVAASYGDASEYGYTAVTPRTVFSDAVQDDDAWPRPYETPDHDTSIAGQLRGGGTF